jgi:omega-amidase
MRIKVAGIQIGAVASKEENVEKAREMLESLASSDLRPHFVCLPEMFSYTPDVEDDFESIDRVAEEIDGPSRLMFSAYAKKLGAHIITGSYIQRRDGKHYNTSLLIAPDGKLLAQYSKTHLFDTPEYKESWFITPGNRITVVDTPYCRIGMIICYDIRFPELLKTIALKGAELIFCPAAFPIAGVSPGADHWETLTRAAALQNMVYLVAINQIGFIKPFYYFGRSVIVDPWGIELAKASNKECIIFAELDLKYLEQMRKERAVFEHRRPDLYEL